MNSLYQSDRSWCNEMKRRKGQHSLYPPENPSPGRLSWWVSKFYQFVLQMMCCSFPLFISSTATPLPILFQVQMWLWEINQMTSSWHIRKFLLYVFSASLSILIKQKTHPNISRIDSNFPKYPFLPPDSPPLLTSRKLIINTLAFLSHLVLVL